MSSQSSTYDNELLRHSFFFVHSWFFFTVIIKRQYSNNNKKTQWVFFWSMIIILSSRVLEWQTKRFYLSTTQMRCVQYVDLSFNVNESILKPFFPLINHHNVVESVTSWWKKRMKKKKLIFWCVLFLPNQWPISNRWNTPTF